ncbi:hypothetical protein M0R04_14115 [Candidatus Dojkabacteria bacterium]|jgi:hypothetical protein|nr:hypothetical protein [Candidatus Dojkabacteria bacterium]
MKSILEFYQDTDTKNNVHEYLAQFFKEEAVRRLMNREDAVALADATDMLNKAFENMEVLFAPKSEGKEIKNEAR